MYANEFLQNKFLYDLLSVNFGFVLLFYIPIYLCHIKEFLRPEEAWIEKSKKPGFEDQHAGQQGSGMTQQVSWEQGPAKLLLSVSVREPRQNQGAFIHNPSVLIDI